MTRTGAPKGADAVPDQRNRDERTALLHSALEARNRGLCVLPVAVDGTKAPHPSIGKWTRWQSELPDVDTVVGWFTNYDTDGMGIVCGPVSDGLELLEFEAVAVDDGTADAFAEACEHAGLGRVLARIVDGYTEQSAGGGIHLLYRCTSVDKNTKLARRPDGDKVQVLIETRGEGGFAVVAPSAGRTHPNGRAWKRAAATSPIPRFDTIARITPEERSELHRIARMFDEMPSRPIVHPPAAAHSNGDRPGDRFNLSATWADVLEGWTHVYDRGHWSAWRRPGKEPPGISATTNHEGTDRLKVFSTSTVLDTEGTYSKFEALTMLRYDGDFAAAARALADTTSKAGPSVTVTEGQVKNSAQPFEPDGVYLVRASSIEPEQVDYLDEPLIPLRVVTLMVGLDGVGKSTVLYTKAAHGTRGTLDGIYHGEPINVVIASSEDHDASVIVPRLLAAGADLDYVHIVKVCRDGLTGDIALPDDLDALEDKVLEVDARLLIVDPLVAHLPMNIDSHKAQHIRRVLGPLAHLAETGHLAVTAVVHFNGTASADVRSRINGSKAIRDASRSVIVCGTDPDDETQFVMCQDKNSFGPRSNTGKAYRIETAYAEHRGQTFKTSRVVWLGDITIDSRGLLSGGRSDDNDPQIRDAESVLAAILADGPMWVKDVFDAMREAGFTKDQAKRAKAKLGIHSAKFGKPGDTDSGWKWVPPRIANSLQPEGSEERQGSEGSASS
jgi:hypothetical protein